MSFSYELINIVIYFWIFIIGLINGSFIYCYAYRKAHNINKKRSVCDYCLHQLSVRDLFPLISYILNKGKCRYCGNKISIKYPISELLTAVIYVIVYHRFGWQLKTLHYLILFSLLLIISISDIENYLIPNELLIIIIINKLLFIIYDNYQYLYKSLLNGLIISLLVLLISIMMKIITGKQTIGGGDIKLLFALGIYFDFYDNLFFLLLSCVLGLLYLLITNKYKELFPFAPYICLSFILLILFVE